MHSVPPMVLRWLEERHGSVVVEGAVGGGCVNPAARVRLDGEAAFLKWNASAPGGMFEVEAEGLRALGAAGALRVPEVLGAGGGDGADPGLGWLLLEWLEPATPGLGFGERLGRGLAVIHEVRGDGWGWARDGFVGPLPQPNRVPGADRGATWAHFWRGCRLEPMLRRAHDAGWRVGGAGEWEALWRVLPDLLAPAEADGPSLLHGDLWNGNVLAAAAGDGAEPALVDPATYHGHREVDLAMAELFGGFAVPFFEAYHETWPLQPGYRPGRRAAYQLFPLLVHVVLFGSGYLARAEGALRDALRAA
jgi:protein-ribulosamine 3-kinase